MNTPPEPKAPIFSVVALCCLPAIGGALLFLSTQQGRNFNEHVFGRYYTAGMLLAVGAYGVFFIGLLVLGVVAALAGIRRNETPSWLPKFALWINLAIPAGVFLYRSFRNAF